MINTEFKVSIVIPNYNGEELLPKCLPKIVNAVKIVENNILEIIIVDDCSKDDSVKFVKENYPEVRLIRHRVNRGFSSAVNTGVRSSRGNIICLINSDVIPEKNFLAYIIPHFKDKYVFAVSMHEKGYGWARGGFEKGFIVHQPGDEVNKAKKTFWVSGGSGCFRRDYWVKLGGFDEKLFSPFYWEDVDLCYRALKRNYSLLWEPKARVTHEHESTIRNISKTKRVRIQERNQLLFIWKNLTSTNLFKRHITGLFKRIAKHPGYIKIVFLALLKLRLVKKARLKEKKECKVSDEAIFASF